jgi:long-chain fatty acid transport protein
MKMRKKNLALAIAVAAAVASPSAFATNGILQAGNGMVAHGVGGAGLANAAEASSGMDNPALISHTGTAVNVAWSMFMPLRELDATAVGGSKVASDSNEFAIPQASFTVKSSNLISWGVMAYALGGMNTDYPTGPYGGNPQTVNLQGLIVSPQISFAFTKDLSFGVAALIGKESLRTRNLFGQGASGTGEDSEVGFGAKLGLNWNVAQAVSLGFTLQPKMSFGEMDYFKNLISNFGFTGDAQLTLPDQYGIGGKFGIGKSVDIVADIMYYKWSGVDVFDFFGWDDQVVYKVGAEFRPGDAWALRVGYNYGKSPIKAGNRVPSTGGGMDAAFANYPFPAISEHHFTLGAGYKLAKNVSVDGYFLYSPENTEESTTTSQTSGGPVPAGFKVSMRQSAFGVGLNVGF